MPQITERATQLLQQYSNARANRGTYDSHCRDVARLCYSEVEDFYTDFNNSSHGEKKNLEIFDATAQHALTQFSSVMESLITPAHSRWHFLGSTDPELKRDQEVIKWYEEVNTVLFNERYDPRAAFQGQMNQGYMSLGAFGTKVMFIDARRGGGLRYKNIFLGDVYFDENHQGIVDQVYRRFDFSNQQALEAWGEDAIPDVVKKELEHQKFDVRHEYVHFTVPNNQIERDKDDFRGMPYASIFVHKGTAYEVEVSGYRTFPYAVSRYFKSPHEVTGRGPCMQVLPDIRTLNQMAHDQLSLLHKSVYTALLVHDDGVFGAGQMDIDLSSGGLNFGGVSAEGRPLIQPLNTGAQPNLNEQHMELKRNVIRQALLVDVFQMVSQKDARMTASEALLRDREKAALLGPVAGREQTEGLSPMIFRELDILFHQGKLPDVPDQLLTTRGGLGFDIRYEAPISKLQRSEEQIGIDRVVEKAVQLAQFDNGEAISKLDSTEILFKTMEASGAPFSILKSEEQIAEEQAAAQAQQQQQMAAEQAPQQAAAMKDMAQAQAIAQGV